MWWFVGGWTVGWSAGRLAVGLWSLYLAVAVTEALEGIIRARLGQNCCDNLAVAVTEALEVVVRAGLGQNCCDNLSVAVTEALEGIVRARLGQNCCDNLAVAVTEPLEVVVRAVLGAQNPGAVSAPLKVLKRRRSVGSRFKMSLAPFRRR